MNELNSIKSKKKKVIFGVLMVLIIIALPLIVGEIMVRIFSPERQRATGLVTFNKEWGSMYRPNLEIEDYGACPNTRETKYVFSTNSKGLRDDEYFYEKGPHKRVIILGDSFTAGRVASKNTFPEVLETLLRSYDDRFQVINAGKDGWGTDNEYLFYENEGYKYEPDLVILAFFFNDVDDVLKKGYYSLDNNELVFNGVSSDYIRRDKDKKYTNAKIDLNNTNLLRRLKALLFHSALYKFLIDAVLPKYPRLSSWLVDIGMKSSPVGHESPPEYFKLYSHDYDNNIINAWDITKRLIGKLNQLCVIGNSKFGVVLINAPWQIYEGPSTKFDNLLKTYPSLDPSIRKFFNKPDEVMIKFLKDENIPYLHLAPIFKKHYLDTGERLHFRCDSHWNIKGNKLAGKLIHKWVLAEKLLK